ncbi:Plasmodium exported protein (Pm-fam-a like), unknown function [Plasmodium malariae]|uniref:Fam-m protein n=1 Tax=Plasmodium malariae TaxID=5858 RepID=A0A1A8WHG6_PLAMA|nr:Plasmodium exported protein (Pm-fam-a like), unknown function [Plasmodium malariae]
MGIFNKYFDKKCNCIKKLYSRSYRLLTKYKHHEVSNIIHLRKNIKYDKKYDKKDISNNEKLAKAKNKQSNRSLLNKAEYYTEVIDYNNGMFDGKHFHFEKKWIKKKDYDDLVEKNRRIRDIYLKKRKFRSYAFGIAIYFLFFLFGIGIPILKGLESSSILKDKGPFALIWKIIEPMLNLAEPKEKAAQAAKAAGFAYFYLITFGVLIIILAAILLITIPKILRNNEKYTKIKLMNE